MKISTRIIVIISSILSFPLNAGNTHSHSFYSLRPNFQSATPERTSLFRNDLLEECQGFGGALELVPYGGVTTQDGRNKLARYFLPPGCTTTFLFVKEYNTEREKNIANTDDGNPLKNLEARNFNIRTVEETFASTISIFPEQAVFGFGICYKQTLTAKCDGTPGFWFEISLPIERVRNRMNLKEVVENDGGGPIEGPGLDNAPIVGNMIEALKQCSWHYGRILKKDLTETAIADVELKFGYNSWACDTYTIATYATIVIPTGTHVRSRTLFEPIVGNNRHFGFSLGSSYAYEVWCRGSYTIQMFLDNNTRYLFSNYQVRSFDPIGKPWGRYLSTYRGSEEAFQAMQTNNQNSGTSGINIFTQCVRVSPYLAGSFNTAFLLTRHCDCTSFEFEGGYNLFVRQAENIDLESSTRISDAAIKGINGMGFTTIARNIADNFQASQFALKERYATLSNCDIDIESGAHPATISNTIYGTLGYRWEQECPYFVAIGGSYEFTTLEVNAAPDRWLIWGKFAVTF